jgi:hypothetical protein
VNIGGNAAVIGPPETEINRNKATVEVCKITVKPALKDTCI